MSVTDDTLHARLLAEAEKVLAPVVDATGSRDDMWRLFASIGWDIKAISGLDILDLQATLNQFRTAYQSVAALVENPPDSLEAMIGAIDTIAEALSKLRGIPALIAGVRPPDFEQLAAHLLEHLLVTYLERNHPAVWSFAVLVSLAELADDAEVVPLTRDPTSNAPARYPHARPRLRLAQLSQLLTDPVATLKAEYSGTPEQVAEKMFPRLP